MSTLTLMSLLITTSSILCFFMNSWIALWILLELNTLSFCTMSSKIKTENKKMTKENIMKYFSIQAIASSIMIMSSTSTKSPKNMKMIMSIMLISSIITKMAAVPFFQWMINMCKKISWMNNSILLTWQKLAPLYLLFFQKKNTILLFTIPTAIVSSLLLINKTSLKEILAFSSLFNLSWSLITIMLGMKLFIMFMLFYWTISLSIIFLLWKKNQENLTKMKYQKFKKEILFIMILSLGGMPPLLGFLMKWMVLEKILFVTKMMMISSLIVILSSINMFIYLRMMNPIFISQSSISQKMQTIKKTKVEGAFLMMNFIPIVMIFV